MVNHRKCISLVYTAQKLALWYYTLKHEDKFHYNLIMSFENVHSEHD